MGTKMKWFLILSGSGMDQRTEHGLRQNCPGMGPCFKPPCSHGLSLSFSGILGWDQR